MPLIRIKDFGHLGINVDKQATLLEPGAWTQLSNIDTEAGDIRSAWGDTPVAGTPPCEPKYLYRFEGLSRSWIICSDGVHIYAHDGATWVDITPSFTAAAGTTWQDLLNAGTTWQDLIDTSTTWAALAGDESSPVPFAGEVSFTTFGGLLVVCPSQGPPVYWPGESGRMTPLPGWDLTHVAHQVIAFANHLVAISLDDGTIEGAKFRVAWSDAAAEGEIPQSWTATPENLAGSVQLRDTPAPLTVAEILRDNLVIYKADSIYRMFLRGDELIMGFERVIVDHGCDSWRGVTRLGDVHFFADSGDIRVFDGQVTKSITEHRIKERLAAAISNTERDKTIVVANPDREEVWVGVVPAAGTTFDAVLVYSLTHDAWTLKEYPSTLAMTMGHLSTESVAGGNTWQDLHDKGITWATWHDTWGSHLFDPSERGITFGRSGMIFQADKSHTDADGAPKYCQAERRGFMLADLPQRVTVRAVYPEMEGAAPVQMQIGAQWHPGDSVRWTPPQEFRPGIDHKINVRITGQPTALRVTSQVSQGWRLGALSLDVVEAGQR